MPPLKTDGFEALVAATADRARRQVRVADAVRVASTLDGRVPEAVGWAALAPADRILIEEAGRCGAVLATGEGEDGGEPGDVLLLTDTGRLAVVDSCRREGHQPEWLGTIKWPIDPAPIRQRRHDRRRAADDEFTAVAGWLATEPAARVRRRLDRIEFALMHMAPVRMYVGDRTYSNLTRSGNLPGKSLRPGAARSLPTLLAAAPVPDWAVEDATFVVCLAALLRSGPAVRAEEFNGVQLTPGPVAEFLCDLLTRYGGDPATEPDLPRLPAPEAGCPAAGPRLEALADACSRRRTALLRGGATFYRTIFGVNLHKREHVDREAVRFEEVPGELRQLLGEQARSKPPESFDQAGQAVTGIAARLTGPVPPPAGFRTAHGAFLHEAIRVTNEALAADVAMGRGPRWLRGLAAEVTPAPERVRWGTKEFYCCVTASRSFIARFDQQREELVRALTAYSARMRYNTWHYLPDSLAITDTEPGRADWFFAPTMPDLTTWSDQHHTGHVAFGVRHAIRVPFGIVFDGAYRPALYDLRLLRTTGDPFTVRDLRSSIAVGRVLGLFHQAMAEVSYTVDDFGNSWYQAYYG